MTLPSVTLPSVNPQVVMNPQIQQKALRKWCSARGIHVQAFHSLVSLAPPAAAGLRLPQRRSRAWGRAGTAAAARR